MTKRVSVFIDGFNFYYGAYMDGPLKVHPKYKWMNPVKLGDVICRELGVNGRVNQVHYCTAKSKPSASDPGQVTRQQFFLRALDGLPEVEIAYGQHRDREKSGMSKSSGKIERFMVREEKGTDVNLAVRLVRDAALDLYDIAIVVSNDSDLKAGLVAARDDFNREVIVVSPHFNGSTGRTKKGYTFVRPASVVNDLQHASTKSCVMDPKWLEECRLPDPSLDAAGKLVHCPKEWN